MKKFKHKQTGIIAVKDGVSYKLETGNMIPSFIFENSNDWEEIVEKDYKILCFKRLEDNSIFNINVNGSYSNENDRFFNENLFLTDNHRFSIYKVKRLSDGEVFTVGDKIIFEQFNSKSIIRSFKIYSHRIKVNTKGIDFLAGSYYLESINHVKKPLFTTEDGVDIFEGDDLWIVNKNNNIISWEHCVKEGMDDTEKYFSTKETAEEYILMNKPCLSINDLYKVFVMEKNIKNELIKLIIQKDSNK